MARVTGVVGVMEVVGVVGRVARVTLYPLFSLFCKSGGLQEVLGQGGSTVLQVKEKSFYNFQYCTIWRTFIQ